MLASGQLVNDIKDEYRRHKRYQPQPKKWHNTSDDQSLGEQSKPNPPPPQTDPEEEEHFKHVGSKLTLNQSAMTPDKETLANQKLEDLAEKSDNVLLKVSTVFPFTFFVNDIIIDPYKVNVIYREFFFSEHIHSILIRDILDIVVETSLFFATVKIVDQGYVENTVDIPYLKKSDALKVRKIIQGLVIAHRQSVDLSTMHPKDIKNKTEELGKVKGIDDTPANEAAR